MKKGLICLATIISIMFITGCGESKVLECTKSKDMVGYSLSETETVKFSGNNVDEYEAEFDLVLDDSYKKYKEKFVKELEDKGMSKYTNLKGVKLTTKETDEGVIITLTAQIKKMSSDDLKTLNIEKKANYDATKKDREADGYTCK